MRYRRADKITTGKAPVSKARFVIRKYVAHAVAERLEPGMDPGP